MKRWIPILLLISTFATLFAFQAGKSDFYELSSSNELSLPQVTDFRKWHHAGSSVIPNNKNSGKAIFPGIHNVYIDPDSFKHHREKGVYPDGTIIVMEVLHIDLKESVGGFGYFTTGGQDILVQIKDGRAFREGFPGGWAYYLFRDKDIKAGVKIKAPEDRRCGACHQADAEEDQVFTQYHPTLRKE